MSDWQTIDTAPAARLLMTKIHDKDGIRNEAALYRSSSLWFVPDGGLYVYYLPTHWRELTPAERRDEASKLDAARSHNLDNYDKAIARLAP